MALARADKSTNPSPVNLNSKCRLPSKFNMMIPMSPSIVARIFLAVSFSERKIIVESMTVKNTLVDVSRDPTDPVTSAKPR